MYSNRRRSSAKVGRSPVSISQHSFMTLYLEQKTFFREHALRFVAFGVGHGRDTREGAQLLITTICNDPSAA